MKKWLSICLLASIVLVACKNTNSKESFVKNVILVEPKIEKGYAERVFSGTVKERHQISLGFKTAGQIEKLYVKEGQYVKKGDLIAVLDDSDYSLGVEALQIQYNQLKNEVARIEKLYEGNSISGNDYEKAVSGLKQLEVQLNINKKKVEYTKLFAPVNGVVQSVNFSPSEMVDAGTAVISLLDINQMEVVVDVPADIYNQRAEIKNVICKKGDDKYKMNLVNMTPKADGNQLYQIYLSFNDAPNKIITPGVNIEVVISLNMESGERVLYSLPLNSLFSYKEQSCVWVYGKDSLVHLTPVEVSSIDSNGDVLVYGDINENSKVVKAGVDYLVDKERVNVIEAPSVTNVGGLK